MLFCFFFVLKHMNRYKLKSDCKVYYNEEYYTS